MVMERASCLGGMTTRGGVCFPGLFDAWGKQIIAGIGWELVKECVELDGGALPNFAKVPQRHWQNQVHINQFLYYILAEASTPRTNLAMNFHKSLRRKGLQRQWLRHCCHWRSTRQRNVLLPRAVRDETFRGVGISTRACLVC
jgi:hypothetical protein